MLQGDLVRRLLHVVDERQPGPPQDQLTSTLRDPRIDQCIAENQCAIERDAKIAGVDLRTYERQVRLHLPAVWGRFLVLHRYRDAYDMVRSIALVRSACIRQECETAEFRANASLLISRKFLAKKDLKLHGADGANLDLRFGEVKPSVGNVYQARLHYLRSVRGDTTMHFGIFLPGALYPLTYVALSVCDRPYIADSLIASKLDCDRKQCLVITRMYGLPGIPKNLMSITLRQVVLALRRQGQAKLLLTAYNPMLGFSGAAFRASGFYPFATAPVSYHYDERGEFVTRRSVGSSLRGVYETPPNILLVRGIDRNVQREIIDHVQLTNISTSDYEKRVALDGTLPNVVASVWLKELKSYRKMLQDAWSQRTIHPSYLGSGHAIPSSKGQCGVSSVWLARELYETYGVHSTYCYGDLLFSDEDLTPVKHHCWIEIGDVVDGCRLVIDLTCDQADSIEDQVLCSTHDDLVRQGLRYEARTRLKIKDLPHDRVWDRFMALCDALPVSS
jgi:hypothetical protein